MKSVNDKQDVGNIFQNRTKFKEYYNYLCNFSKKSEFDSIEYLKTKDASKLSYLQQHLDFDYFDISIALSIDFVKIFYPVKCFSRSTAKEIIKNHCTNVHYVKDSKSISCGFVDIKGVKYKVVFTFVSFQGFYKGLSIRLIHPSPDLIEYIEKVFGLVYVITSVEYSMDLRSNDNERLLSIIACTMVQKYSRKSLAKVYNTTYYCSNPRTAATLGSYVYHKTVDTDDFVRIECRYKNPFFKKNKITKMKDACSISPQVIIQSIDFKLFNLRRFLKKFLRMMSVTDGDDASKARTFEEYFFENFNERQGGGILSVAKMLQQMLKNCHTYFDTYPFKDYLEKLMVGKSFM